MRFRKREFTKLRQSGKPLKEEISQRLWQRAQFELLEGIASVCQAFQHQTVEHDCGTDTDVYKKLGKLAFDVSKGGGQRSICLTISIPMGCDGEELHCIPVQCDLRYSWLILQAGNIINCLSTCIVELSNQQDTFRCRYGYPNCFRLGNLDSGLSLTIFLS